MGWREDWIARHKQEIAQMRTSIDWLRSGQLEIKEVSTGGQVDNTSRRDEMIAHYERVIPELEAIISKLESGV